MDEPGEAKVAKLQLAACREQQIVGLDVAMDDALAMEKLEGPQQGHEVGLDVVRGEGDGGVLDDGFKVNLH